MALALALAMQTFAQTAYDYTRLSRERMNRGVVAVRTSPDSVCVQWRYLESDPVDVSFEILRNGRLIGRRAANESTFFMDYNPVTEDAVYRVRPVYRNGQLPAGMKTSDIALLNGQWTLPAHAPMGYIDIPLTPPEVEAAESARSAVGRRPVVYTANDATMGDLDGDGQLEIPVFITEVEDVFARRIVGAAVGVRAHFLELFDAEFLNGGGNCGADAGMVLMVADSF